MKVALSALIAIGMVSVAPQQNGQPINAMCPVKPKQKARAQFVVIYKGQVIGFC